MGGVVIAMRLTSDAFEHGGNIPVKYSCNGEDISPHLKWSDPPMGVKSFCLIMEDPDTPLGVFTHWVLFNIPTDKRELQENIPKRALFDDGMIQGRNGYLKNSFIGPCPPWGRHRYIFTFYALDILLEPDPKLNKKKLLQQISDHILDKTELLGYYSRKHD